MRPILVMGIVLVLGAFYLWIAGFDINEFIGLCGITGIGFIVVDSEVNKLKKGLDSGASAPTPPTTEEV